ncbi:MAG: hypothetical protein RBR15_15540 [Sphaerochaeta sp.]|nr:hypothetical protein [Sphaerochaeta sp.]
MNNQKDLDTGEDIFAESHDDTTITFFAVPPEDKKFELKNWPIPEDEDCLCQDLFESGLYTFNGIEEAEKQLLQLGISGFSKDIIQFGPLVSIEELFTGMFDELDFPVMNTFFWILLHKGKGWVPLRSYAIEMLKWIPEIIFSQFDDHKQFISTFSTFVQKVLCTRGLCIMEKEPTNTTSYNGTYSIQATETFFCLLQPSEDVAINTVPLS